VLGIVNVQYALLTEICISSLLGLKLKPYRQTGPGRRTTSASKKNAKKEPFLLRYSLLHTLEYLSARSIAQAIATVQEAMVSEPTITVNDNKF
jgi:hypothetical protein